MRIGRTETVSALLLATSACGGGGGAIGGGGGTPAPAQNVASIAVDSGPAGTVNTPFVSVTVCAPGGTNCQTIDHVTVDTGSSGLRILASVLTLPLPQAQDAMGQPLGECIQFADGYSWGPVTTADVKITGEQASSLPVQVIGDAAFPAAPSSCSSAGPAENTVQAFGANGILGIGVFREDCGAACATAAVPGTYYSCPASGCTPTAVALAQQVQNPVIRFASNNNGVIVRFSTIGSAGAATVSGSLIFGIDTQSNNALGTATVLMVDASTGGFTTIFGGQSLAQSFIDSGSNGLFFPDASLPVCTSTIASGFYCPTSVQVVSATNQSVTGVSSNVSFNVANADALLNNNPTFYAFNNLAGTNPRVASFDWGLPFFYGRSVFVAIEGQTTSSGTGPFVAY
jgi:hypothetical protein